MTARWTPSAYLFATPLVFLTGCLEFDIEQFVATFVWSPDTQSIQLDLVAQNIGANYFDCEETAESCAASIAETMAEGDLFNLKGEGCANLTESLEEREKFLDIRTQCSFPDNAPLAWEFGIHIESEGRLGKEKPHLLLYEVLDGSWRDLPKSAKRRVIQTRDDEGATEEQVSWSLKHTARTGTNLVNMQENVTPVFQTFGELPALLREKGLLKP